MQNGLTPKIRMLYFVIINSVLFNLSCVWVSRKNKERQSKARQGKTRHGKGRVKKRRKKKKQNKIKKAKTGCHYVRTYGSTNQPY